MSEYLQWDAREGCLVPAVEASPVVFPGYEEFEFFVSHTVHRQGEEDHDEDGWNRHWIVSEKTTGAFVSNGSWGYFSADQAIAEAAEILAKYGPETTRKQIAKRKREVAGLPVKEMKDE